MTCFALSYFTQRWNAYVTENVLQIEKNRNSEVCLLQRQNTFNCIEKVARRLRFMNLSKQ